MTQEVEVVARDENEAAKVSPMVFTTEKLWSVVEALKANDVVLFYKLAFEAEEVNYVNRPKRKAKQKLHLILPLELKIGSAIVTVSHLTDDSFSPSKSAMNGKQNSITRHQNVKLPHWYDGPYKIVEKTCQLFYENAILEGSRVNLVFHFSVIDMKVSEGIIILPKMLEVSQLLSGAILDRRMVLHHRAPIEKKEFPKFDPYGQGSKIKGHNVVSSAMEIDGLTEKQEEKDEEQKYAKKVSWLVVEPLKANVVVLFCKVTFAAEDVSCVNHLKRKAELELHFTLSVELKIRPSVAVSDLLDDSFSPVKSVKSCIVFCLEAQEVEAPVAKTMAVKEEEWDSTEGHGEMMEEEAELAKISFLEHGSIESELGRNWEIEAAFDHSCGGGQDDATAFENYLIKEHDVAGSGFLSVMGFVSFLDEINQDVLEYINESNGKS
ncbi:sec23/sec24 transport family protein [Perilla frutescens var. hirtella]|uniref:Sec23/sec24 transport family protein n=1 Tax=Perilla frutescens var. hirtella TaxID=608512 RepID=A0AAD4IZP7_PERFH|nr:sec23/sec24 transport family protein [Perilla frutescens var. hirtella]